MKQDHIRICNFSNAKGGVGKTGIGILTARFLAAAGYSVLFIDSDLYNNSATYHFASTPEEIQGRSLAEALRSNDAVSNIIHSSYTNVDYIAANMQLMKLRSINYPTFKKLLRVPGIEDTYDYVIIDSPPTFDNFVCAAVYASDYIIIPFQLSQSDIKASSFYFDLLDEEFDNILETHKFILTINRVQYRSNETAEDSWNNQYRSLARDTFREEAFTYCKNFIEVPERSSFKAAIDIEGKLISISEERLFSSFRSIAGLLGAVTDSVTQF
jgi:chromosome partitioning protein